ncbi:LysR family transcriptional regulator [Leisingera caerulea]|uniref:LysR family transcriptional regulator n=1 Tax=Leisingera caerulea TaxID=506591 RepID=A0A9Q9HJS2_LEICA|nr:LysR family transcriptional regulator [Leisingera caerulea]UWQ54274.1 LysR family transcriptional regulator [Leisingera caerulea]UWQ58872.1 LysR family transcriptional regulator [Leisingera caerulea]
MDDISSINRKLSYNLVALHTFDLVARHGNFTGAAEALGLTQSAVSQKIKGLETELGIALFRREHRGVSLTNEGVRLLNVVRPAMTQIGNSLASLLERKSRPRVRISADFAFASFWLLPRLSHLRAELGDEIEIQILASQVPPDDYGEDCDIKIHVGPRSSMGGGDVMLLQERVGAVCSPAYLERHGPVSSAAGLLDCQLLSLSKPASAEWQTWQGWFDRLGITGERSKHYISFNNYDMVVQSAVSGDGIALGWLGLIDRLLQSGALVQAVPDVVASDAGYVMSRDYSSRLQGPSLVFDWIAEHLAGAGRL